MNNQEVMNLKIGDVVVISQHGRNKGKQGVVSEIGSGTAYLKPLNCEFEFSSTTSWRLHRRKEGLYGFSYVSIQYPIEPHKKEFYVGDMFGPEGLTWSARNFTIEELNTINKFIEELKTNAIGTTIETFQIAIIGKEK